MDVIADKNATEGENRRAWDAASCDHPDGTESMGMFPEEVTARALPCYWARRELGMTATEIAKRLKMGQPAVSRLSKRGRGGTN
jgi:DNA-binding transcriptional ArsR family regulator